MTPVSYCKLAAPPSSLSTHNLRVWIGLFTVSPTSSPWHPHCQWASSGSHLSPITASLLTDLSSSSLIQSTLSSTWPPEGSFKTRICLNYICLGKVPTSSRSLRTPSSFWHLGSPHLFSNYRLLLKQLWLQAVILNAINLNNITVIV